MSDANRTPTPDQTPPAVSDAMAEVSSEPLPDGNFGCMYGGECWAVARSKEEAYRVGYRRIIAHQQQTIDTLLHNRQSAEARSAAGVEAAFRAGWQARGDDPGGDMPDASKAGAAAIASLLAAAFDAGWNCSGEGWNSEYGVTPERFEQMKTACLAQIVPTPTAGGADDAG